MFLLTVQVNKKSIIRSANKSNSSISLNENITDIIVAVANINKARLTTEKIGRRPVQKLVRTYPVL